MTTPPAFFITSPPFLSPTGARNKQFDPEIPFPSQQFKLCFMSPLSFAEKCSSHKRMHALTFFRDFVLFFLSVTEKHSAC